MYPFGFTAEVLLATRDQHGDEQLAQAGTIPGCAFAQVTSTEDTGNRAQEATAGELYCQPGEVVVTAQHRIKLPGGEIWHVDGQPERWDRPFSGGCAGVVIHLRRVKG